MRILLDSHTFLWALGADDRLGSAVRFALGRTDVEVWLSAATIWELGIKIALGRLHTRVPLRELLAAAVSRGGMRVLMVSPEHALRASELPLHHRDPFDRMLVAQAMAEDLRLASADVKLDAYGLDRLWT